MLPLTLRTTYGQFTLISTTTTTLPQLLQVCHVRYDLLLAVARVVVVVIAAQQRVHLRQHSSSSSHSRCDRLSTFLPSCGSSFSTNTSCCCYMPNCSRFHCSCNYSRSSYSDIDDGSASCCFSLTVVVVVFVVIMAMHLSFTCNISQ